MAVQMAVDVRGPEEGIYVNFQALASYIPVQELGGGAMPIVRGRACMRGGDAPFCSLILEDAPFCSLVHQAPVKQLSLSS